MKNRFYSFLMTLFMAIYVFADPPVPGDDGGGTTGTGSPASPIDMYIVVLAVIAISMIFVYARKYRKQLI